MQKIDNPLILMFREPDSGHIITHIYPGVHNHKHYGILVCDLVRHIAQHFDCEEEDIWEWVDAERDNPTTEVRRVS